MVLRRHLPTSGLGILCRLGLLDPARVAATAAALGRWGPTLGALYRAAALRWPTRPAVYDHRGTLRYADLDRRSSALAAGLLAAGLRTGQHLGLLCRNHRDFVEANLAAAKAGLHPVYLNTGFAAPQLAEVVEREGVAGLVCDAALHPVVDAAGFDRVVVAADGEVEGTRSLRQVRGLGRRRPRLLRPHLARPVLLTSGTTGAPKGARRTATQLDGRGAAGLFQRIPYRTDDVFVIASPLFHAWGLSQLVVAATLGAPVVLSPTFSPVGTVRSVVEHRATVLTVVPVMLQRILDEPDCDPAAMRALRIVASSGSALPAAVGEAWMDRVGDTLYNLYGSTEVGQATVATPEDLRAAPGTVGRVVPGSDVVILDDAGRMLPAGAEGRIFVASGAQFTGYTGGGSKEVLDGRMATGDIGRFDADGRLFVTGRSDDMIVSGGENVFPAEVEELLLAHPAIADAAVVGVEDEGFGQRLAAYIVPAAGAHRAGSVDDRGGRNGHRRVDADAVRDYVAQRLARHKVPRDVTFVDRLPRTTTGKLLRWQLVDPGGADGP